MISGVITVKKIVREALNSLNQDLKPPLSLPLHNNSWHQTNHWIREKNHWSSANFSKTQWSERREGEECHKSLINAAWINSPSPPILLPSINTWSRLLATYYYLVTTATEPHTSSSSSSSSKTPHGSSLMLVNSRPGGGGGKIEMWTDGDRLEVEEIGDYHRTLSQSSDHASPLKLSPSLFLALDCYFPYFKFNRAFLLVHFFNFESIPFLLKWKKKTHTYTTYW